MCLHVGLDVDNRAHLVIGELPGERILELALPRRVGRVGVAARRPAHGGDAQEFGRHFSYGLFDPGLAPAPRRATEPVELRLGLEITGGIPLDEIRPFHRNQQAVPALVLEDQHLESPPFDLDSPKAGETPDTVIHVHDEVATFEVAQVGSKGGNAALRGRGRGAAVRFRRP